MKLRLGKKLTVRLGIALVSLLCVCVGSNALADPVNNRIRLLLQRYTAEPFLDRLLGRIDNFEDIMQQFNNDRFLATPGNRNRVYNVMPQLQGQADSYNRASLLIMIPGEIDNFESVLHHYYNDDLLENDRERAAFVDEIEREFSCALFSDRVDDVSPTVCADDTPYTEDIMYENALDYTDYGNQWRAGGAVYDFVESHADAYDTDYFVNLINTLRRLVRRIYEQNQ